ncbi:MAG: hypothetical protein ACLR6I_19780 [Waltera sp.]
MPIIRTIFTGTSCRRKIQKLLSKQVEGIDSMWKRRERLGSMESGVDLPIPTVVAYGFTNKPEIPSVVVKDKGGAEQLVRYSDLLRTQTNRCHRREKEESIHTQSRLEGYQSALFEANLPYDPGTIVFYGATAS